MQKVLHYSKAMEKKNCKVSGEYLQTVKYDGWYTEVTYTSLSGWGRFQASSGSHIPALDWIDLKKLLGNPKASCKLVMEAVIPDGNIYDVNSALKKLRVPAKDITLKLHDMIYLGEKKTALERWENVVRITDVELIQPVKLLGISSKLEDWLKNYDSVVAAGGEGIVLKRATGYYSPNMRNEDLLKMKCEISADLLCIAVALRYGDKGEPSLTLILEDAHRGKHSVVVPKDADRDLWSKFPELIVGRVVLIRAMQKNSNGSFREPRFGFIREDKIASQID